MYDKSIIYYAYLCCMKKPNEIIQTTVQLDYDKDKSYIILTEFRNNVPIGSYSVKMPDWVWFGSYDLPMYYLPIQN